MSPTTSHLPPRIQTRSCISPPLPPPPTNHIPFLKSDHVCHPPSPQPIPLIIQTTSCMSPPPPTHPTTSLFLNQTMHTPPYYLNHIMNVLLPATPPPPPPPPSLFKTRSFKSPPHNTTQPNQQSSNTHTQNTHSPSFLSSLLP